MSKCKFCDTEITWTKRAGKNVPLNIDGTDHRCKDGKNIPSTEKVPTQIGQLTGYTKELATFTLKDGKTHSYAMTQTIYSDWQKAAFLLPVENHPDVWLEFSVDSVGFVRTGAKVTQKPTWAAGLEDPTKGLVTAFTTGAKILQENLDEKRAESEHPDCFKPALCPKSCDGTKDPCQFKPKKPVVQEPPKEPSGSPAPTNPPTGAGTAPQTTPAAPQGHDLESVVRSSIQDLMPSDRVGYRISLAGMVNSVIEMEKLSTDAPKTYAELEDDVKKKALALFIWCDNMTT